jgi:hypothetical protein
VNNLHPKHGYIFQGLPHKLQASLMRLLYIGSVPISPEESGGSIVLWRHQQLFQSGRITEAQSSFGTGPGWGKRLTRGLRRCRLGRLVFILEPWLRSLDSHLTSTDVRTLQDNFDAILTVAHGLGWVDALAVATSCHKPLITKGRIRFMSRTTPARYDPTTAPNDPRAGPAGRGPKRLTDDLMGRAVSSIRPCT